MGESEYPALYRLKELTEPEVTAPCKDGKWRAARKLGYPSLLSRLRLAWGVFTGRYDALDWRE